MKLYFLIVLAAAIFFSTSCNKTTCDMGDKYAKKYAQGISDRWKCTYSVVYTDMVSVLNKTVCAETPIPSRITLTGDMAFLACTAVSTAISKFGALYIQTKWGCDASLVGLDLDKIGNACSLIGIM